MRSHREEGDSRGKDWNGEKQGAQGIETGGDNFSIKKAFDRKGKKRGMKVREKKRKKVVFSGENYGKNKKKECQGTSS
jgi:hypothetical protein